MRNDKVHIMTNAVDTDKFRYSDEVRKAKREELGLTTEFTVGIVGRLEEQKNYPFLIDIFEKVLEKKSDAVLVIVGRGTLDEQIRKLAHDKGIENNVHFLGVRNDVPDLLNAFDVFVLPSIFEGLPVVLVEAQANGLPEIVADTITDEMAVTDLITYLPLGDPDYWSNHILSCKPGNRAIYSDMVANSGYGIKTQAKKMEKKYLNLMRKE